MSLLVFHDLTRHFRNGTKGGAALVPVLDDVNFALEPGEIVALMGRSGAGKTTLLGLAAGLIRPSGGQVLFQGVDLHAPTRRDEALANRLRRGPIGLVFQNNLCLSALPVWENAAFPLLIQGIARPEARKRACALLGELHLDTLADGPTQALSGGQRQRLGIARALLGEPILLLADEPTAELDTATARQVERFLFDHLRRNGCGALIVTHSRAIRERADRTLLLKRGRLHELTPPPRYEDASREP